MSRCEGKLDVRCGDSVEAAVIELWH